MAEMTVNLKCVLSNGTITRLSDAITAVGEILGDSEEMKQLAQAFVSMCENVEIKHDG